MLYRYCKLFEKKNLYELKYYKSIDNSLNKIKDWY